MQTIENQPFIYADIVYDETTRQFGYTMAVLQEDESYDISPPRFGFPTVEEARDAASLEYLGKRTARKVSHRAVTWRILTLWLAANIVAYLLTALLSSRLNTIFYGDNFSPSSDDTTYKLIAFLAIQLLFGMLLGIAQWLVLKRYFLRMHWAGWAIATAISAFLSRFAAPFVYLIIPFRSASNNTLDILRFALVIVSAQLVIGVAQWLVLRRHANHAAWWIPATAASGLIIGVVSGAFYQIVSINGLTTSQYDLISNAVTAIASSIGAIATGLTLARLLPHARTTPPQESIRPALKLA